MLLENCIVCVIVLYVQLYCVWGIFVMQAAQNGQVGGLCKDIAMNQTTAMNASHK